jgi:group I intron endonuclease
MKISGIYKIINRTNGKYYIGSSNNIKRRWIDHKKMLKGNRHDNQYLQNAWNKYGENSFDFVIEKEIPQNKLIEVEQKYFDDTQLKDKIYNLSFIANKIEMTAEIRKKIGDGNRGKIRSEETKKKLSNINKKNRDFYISCGSKSRGNLGRHFSKEWRKKIGDGNRGKIVSEETKKKLHYINLGKKYSEETKQKMSKSSKKFWKNSIIRKLHGSKVSEGYKNMSKEDRQRHRDNIKKSWVLRKLKNWKE